MPIVVGPAPDGTEIVTWVEPNGNRHQLTDTANFLLPDGRSGLWMPPVSLTEDPLFIEAGARLRNVKVNSRTFQIPMILHATSLIELRDLQRSMLQWFDPTAGSGMLEVQDESGDARQLVCRYIGGLDLDESEGSHGPTWQQVVLELQASDPIWRSSVSVIDTYVLLTVPAIFLKSPFLPMRVSGSTVFKRTTVENEGDAPAWPTWTITGPGSNPVVRNLTTGDFIKSTVTLLAGEQLVIDTSPGAKSATDGYGTNLFSTLATDSSFWPLLPGFTDLQIEMAGATTASSVVLEYTPRFLGP